MGTKIKGSKKIAAYSLILMAVGYIATSPFQGNVWVNLLHGGFEAGLVGGLADWFAVTALFRHPLGIPIPHTALLLNNRNRLTEGLVSTVKNDWLSKASIQEKVKNIPFTDRVTAILKKEIHTESFQKMLTRTLKNMIENIEIETITPFVKKLIRYALSHVEVAPFLQIARKKLIQEELDKKTLDHLLIKIQSWLRNKQTVNKLGKITMNALNKIEVSGLRKLAFSSFKSFLTEEKSGQIVQNILIHFLNNALREGDPNRKAIIAYIQNELHILEENKALMNLIEKWKEQLLEEKLPDHIITEKLKEILQKVSSRVDESEFVDTYALPLIERLFDHLTDKNMDVDQRIQKQIIILVEENHAKIGDLVRENLNKLDNETLIDLIESNIGKDLQWIRVNGAFCGFVIGLLLTGIQAIATIW